MPQHYLQTQGFGYIFDMKRYLNWIGTIASQTKAENKHPTHMSTAMVVRATSIAHQKQR